MSTVQDTAAAIPAAAPQPPLTLRTSRYAAKQLIVESGLRPVRISIGHPRWKLAYELAGASRLLMPTRPMLSVEQEPYRELYFRMLETAGVDLIARELASLATPECPGLVLLCFEDLAKPGEFCHRRMFAQWWEERTGQSVPELVEEEAGLFALRP